MEKRITPILILILFTTIFMGCNKDDGNDPGSNPDVINLDDAKLSDFPLFGITPISMNITQPTIVDNQETDFGEINIIIPNTISLNGIASAVTSDELNLSKFNILPGNSTTLNYETQSQTHTIVNVLDESQELLHYTVTIEQEAASISSTLSVTDFKFEASKNTELTDDVTIETSIEDNNRKDIYLFVPAGTDFSDLTPTVTFDAEEVFYTQDSSIPIADVDTPYPTAETNFDFAYPKNFIIVLRDDPNNRIKWVNVIVDVKNPVEIENTDITTPDVITPGSSEYFTGITKWKNIGNHKIQFKSATTYEDKVPSTTVNVITADRNLVTGGLEPGKNADINVQVNANLPVGQYKTTAVFYTKFVGHETIDDVVESVKLNITSNVKN
ncbi:hypothetical protein [Aquimarina pacifica]|uniref:hypothetical protein n=1 Tax=Aquimarina pacifica TaxID=1296415 RepID=UPI0004712263|nr:hypothetical protein [Aquimarina pacifica]